MRDLLKEVQKFCKELSSDKVEVSIFDIITTEKEECLEFKVSFNIRDKKGYIDTETYKDPLATLYLSDKFRRKVRELAKELFQAESISWKYAIIKICFKKEGEE